ncbi:MAG: prenyltransferase/squalene oxidase repeat-containing protein [Chthoniobacteraceae bacterium]
MNSSPDQIPFTRRLQEGIAQTRFITFSLILHAIIVVIGGGAVLFHRMPPPEDFSAPGEIVNEETRTEEPVVSPPTFADAGAEPEIAPIAAPLTPSVIATKNAGPQSLLQLTPFKINIPHGAGLCDPQPQAPPSTRVPPGMASRIGATERMAAAKKNGGTEKSEKAVMAGLRWLKDHQNADGSWSDEFRPAMTGLALLTFLGHGELPESPEFGPTVKKALDWVLARGGEFDGRMSLTKDGFGGNHGVYEHAILTYAMGEYFSMTHDDRFEPLLKKAVGYIVDGQNPVGGWDYGYAKGPRNDLSVAGWQIQALKAAHLTGLAIPGVDEALDKSMAFIKKWQGNEGGFGYTGPENRVSLTGVGVLCTYFWKQDKDRTVKEGIDFLLGMAEVKYKGGKSPADLYAWYYDTQACLMFGGGAWGKWNRLFQDEIANNQSPGGSWPATPGAHVQTKTDGCGPYYRTTLCVLMLEAFYRYAPINK